MAEEINGQARDSEFELQDEEEGSEEAIAQYLVDLSEACPLPRGVAPTKDPAQVELAEAGFSDNGWLNAVREVQAWLCLDRPLPSAASLSDLALSLFGQISSDSPELCIVGMGSDLVRPSDQGCQALEARLARAVEYKQEFANMLDEEASLAEATSQWRAYWEEADSSPSQPVAIRADVDTWPIKEFRDLAEAGQLDLNPSYQRDVVWSNPESQTLIESILRGIPLPSVILTKVEGEARWQIVDGKQRLTAILRFIGHHPQGRTHARSLDSNLQGFDKNFRKFAKQHQLQPRDIAEHFLPFAVRKFKPNDPLHELSGRYFCEIKHKVLNVGDGASTVGEIFEQPNRDYRIPVIVYKRTSLRDIHRVFWLYNKQGKRLNAEELRNAVYHHLDLSKLLLVLSGDRPDQQLAPYLPPAVMDRVEDAAHLLADKGFGTTRFKRTKILSWIMAMLFKAPRPLPGGVLATPSTANHINALLDEMVNDDKHKLHSRPALVQLAKDMQTAIFLHEEADSAWHPRFRTKKNQQGMASKWEELPIVGSLMVCFVLVATGKTGALHEQIEDIREATQQLRGPESTQNKTQWKHIATVVTTVLDRLQLSRDDLNRILREKYGYSCLDSLRQLSAELS